ncbi:MAG: hypothetical protein BWZ08_01760 [candidate division BRC1 bacterium ADurb.BinA292]|nr:MAG: hypothetical protein BWZ08_01760 [candidate division BRC1 bacterium ADurb.BinA292]
MRLGIDGFRFHGKQFLDLVLVQILDAPDETIGQIEPRAAVTGIENQRMPFAVAQIIIEIIYNFHLTVAIEVHD